MVMMKLILILVVHLERVQEGNFGACLMNDLDLVETCLTAMMKSSIPVTVKCRVGLDDDDPYEVLPAELRD